jgi:hypothetical protein
MPKGKIPQRSIAELRAEFWSAPDNAELPRNVTAMGICRSVSWMEKALTGGGIPYRKVGRRVLYRKADALAWLEANSQRVHSTSEYKIARQIKQSRKPKATPLPKRGQRARREGPHA